MSSHAYGFQCIDVFSVNLSGSLTKEELVANLENAVANKDLNQSNMTRDQIVAFTKNKKLVALILKLLKYSLFVEHSFWALIENKLYETVGYASPELVARIQAAEAMYHDSFKHIGNEDQLAKNLRKNSLAAKKEVVDFLIRASRLVSTIFHRPIDLLSMEGWTWLASLDDFSSFDLALKGAFDQRRQRFLDLEDLGISTPNMNRADIVDLLVFHFFNMTMDAQIPGYDFGDFTKSPSFEESIDLLGFLGLPFELEGRYLTYLASINEDKSGGTQLGRHAAYALVIMRAFEHIYGPVEMSTAQPRPGMMVWHGQKYLAFSNFLSVKNKILTVAKKKAINEVLLEGYIEQSDLINVRIENIEAQLVELSRQDAVDLSADIAPVREELSTLEVVDFDVELADVETRLTRLELMFDDMREQVARRVRRENIDTIAGLNSRWDRLLPDKKYGIEGIDYDSVQFTPSVLEFFSKDLVLGTRFLAALSKSYVAAKRQSGLRRFANIHPQMRDIKVIRSHGKIRIVGKLIGKTIHFFYIHNHDRPYSSADLSEIIDNYQP